MNRDILMAALLSGLVTALGFAITGGMNWYANSLAGSMHNKDKMQCLLGLFGAAVIAFVIIAIISIWPDTDKGSTSRTDDTIKTTGSGTTIDEPMPADYVTNKVYGRDVYTGFINLETEQPDGQGTMYYDNGDKYIGEWENGQRHGEGEMTLENGDTYTGAWKNGEKHGTGTYIWHSGERYEGEYKNDLRDGMGDYWGWTGFAGEHNGWAGNYHGFSKDGHFEGKGYFEFENGDKFEGTFRNDDFWNGTYTYSDGRQMKIKNAKPSQ